MTRRMPVVFVVSMVVGAALFHAARAHAFFSRIHAQSCWPNPAAGAVTDSAGYVFNVATNNTVNLFCPLPDNTNQPKNTIGTINVHGRTATGITNPHVQVAECVTFWDQLGGDCNGAVTNTTTGVWGVSMAGVGVLRATDSSHAGGFPYIFVSLSQSGTGANQSALFGLFVQ